MTTAQELLNDKPTESEVERLKALWEGFNSTTQFLLALQQVLIQREAFDYERLALRQFLLSFAQVEADSMNIPLAEITKHPSPNGTNMLDVKVTPQKPEWEYNTPIKFWELSLPEQLIYSAAYAAEFQSSHRAGYSVTTAKNALYTFWRTHQCPRFQFDKRSQQLFSDDDWGHLA